MIMIRRLRESWDVPDDAARVLFVAAWMPVAFLLYQVVGLFGGTLTTARVVFALSLGTLGFCIGCLIHERRKRWLGLFILVISIAMAMSATTVALAEPAATVVWRSFAAALQIVVVSGWGVLWIVRARWLSRSLARSAFLVAAAGVALNLIVNFVYVDPLLPDPLAWGVTAARSIVMRVVGQPLDVGLAVVLWLTLAWYCAKWITRDDKPPPAA